MKRAIGFVAVGMAAGFLSGIVFPHVLGIRGAILGGTLAGGVLACDACRKKKEELPFIIVFGIAVVVSLTSFLLMCGWGEVVRFCVPDPITAQLSQTTWHSALTSFLISLGVLLYCKTHLLRYFLGMPLLSAFPRAMTFNREMNLDDLPNALFFCLVGLFPFLLLWGCVAWRFGFFNKEPANAEGCAVAEKEEA